MADDAPTSGWARTAPLLFSILAVFVLGALGVLGIWGLFQWSPALCLAAGALLFVVVFLVVFVGEHSAAKRDAEFFVAYVFMFFALAASIVPFATVDDASVRRQAFRSISLVRGHAPENSGPRALQGRDNTQWILNVGGSVRAVPAERRTARELMTPIDRGALLSAADPNRIALERIVAAAAGKNRDWALLTDDAGPDQGPFGTVQIADVQERLAPTDGGEPRTVSSSGLPVRRPLAFVAPEHRSAEIAPLYPDHRRVFVTAAADPAGAVIGWLDEDDLQRLQPTFVVTGGLPVPLYLIVLALAGGAVGLLRRVPEYQRRAAGQTLGPDQGPLDPMALRERLVFQIAQFLSAPLIAVTAYYVIAPASTASTVALGFVSGFSSEVVLLAIRTAATKLAPKTTTAAQSGFVEGRVTADGKALKAATVASAKPRIDTRTDDAGRYSLGPLPEGEVELRVDAAPYRATALVEVKADAPVRKDFVLPITDADGGPGAGPDAAAPPREPKPKQPKKKPKRN